MRVGRTNILSVDKTYILGYNILERDIANMSKGVIPMMIEAQYFHVKICRVPSVSFGCRGRYAAF